MLRLHDSVVKISKGMETKRTEAKNLYGDRIGFFANRGDKYLCADLAPGAIRPSFGLFLRKK